METKHSALPYVAYAIDDSLSVRRIDEMPNNARLVGWQCGFEPMFVAVWSYLGIRLDDDEAEELAADYLQEIKWFEDDRVPADYVL